MLRVFVYGTLRFGQRNHHYLADAYYLGPYRTEAVFTMLDTGLFPAALEIGDTALSGDVFTVDSATFAALDRLEDYPLSYTRRLIATDYGDAWIYLWVAPTDAEWPVIAHGDWRRRAHTHSLAGERP